MPKWLLTTRALIKKRFLSTVTDLISNVWCERQENVQFFIRKQLGFVGFVYCIVL